MEERSPSSLRSTPDDDPGGQMRPQRTAGTRNGRRQNDWGAGDLLSGPLVDSNVVAAVIGGDEGVHEANDAFLEMIGCSRDDLGTDRLHWRSITAPEFLGRLDRAMEELRETGRAMPFEEELLRADGIRVPVLIGFALLGSDPLGLMGFALDISEQLAGETERTRLLELERTAR